MKDFRMNTSPQIKMILTAEAGLTGTWEFAKPEAVLIGRDPRCTVHPAKVADLGDLSRFHALIEWNGQEAAITDLGSLGGTWLNCHLIGRRQAGETPAPKGGLPARGDGVKLADGDLITLGALWLRIFITDVVLEKTSLLRSNTCPGCGRPLTKATTLSTPDALCDRCRPNPLAALKLLQTGLKRRITTLTSLKSLRVDKVLGRGATSAVFLVTNKKNNDQQALKVMPPSVSNNNWARKSFLREAALGRAIRHPNVVSLYEYGHYAGAYYVLMEYCSGGSSEEERVKCGGKLSMERALSIILPVLDGLEYLHRVKLATNLSRSCEKGRSTVGLIHRDLKPANIFLGGEDGLTPKIADIGVAKFHVQGGSCDTRTGTVAGSPATMPRQQAMNFKHAGPAVDVWAAAASLYKLLTGEYPRDFPPDVDPWQVVMNDKPRPLTDLLPDAPPHLAEALDQALVDDPTIFHQTAASFKAALLDAIEQDDIWI